QVFRLQRVEVRFPLFGERVPRSAHRFERGRTHGRARGELRVQVGKEDHLVRPLKERALLVPCEVAHDPADRVHLPEVPLGVLLADPTQPPPQTQLADWSRYVTTNEFLIGHIVFSIFGSIFGAIGAVALGTLLIERGSVKLGLAGLLSGLSANVIGTSIFGIAALAQPAIGRLYLSGQTQTAR